MMERGGEHSTEAKGCVGGKKKWWKEVSCGFWSISSQKFVLSLKTYCLSHVTKSDSSAFIKLNLTLQQLSLSVFISTGYIFP